MNKYSDIEIQIANNLLRDGYKWLVRTMRGNVVAFSSHPCKNEGYWLWPSNAESEIVSGKSTPLFQSIKWEDGGPTYIEDIVSPQILDESERQYLGAVIKPFRDKVNFICKVNYYNNPEVDVYKAQHIVIGLDDNSADVVLPLFKAGTMYKGMETGHVYILEDLGL